MKGFAVVIAAAGFIFLAGCAQNYYVKTATPSALPYTDEVADETTLKIVDQRTGDD